MPVASKAVPSVIASSVCWSPQCLVSTLTQRGRWRTLFLFLGSLVQSRCGEGGTLQTNNTGVCSKCLSHTGSAPTHGACSLPAHTAQALGCSPRNHPWPALGCLHLPGPSHSDSGTRVVLRGADSVWACVLCPSQVRAAQVMRCLANAIAATYHLPAAQLSRCTTGAPSQADVDRPDPQEVLVSKEACLQFYR